MVTFMSLANEEPQFYNHMSKEELIRYCDSHCETPRALFSREMVAQMIHYAGRPENFVMPENLMEERQEFFSIHEEMKELVGLARKVEED